ncbi:iron uptake system component EfeO [Naumannella cuiyingiana]|uniref:Iron uptake system component EfeO n=1 Tax=Naumannella cuiyingiana TaxID=1347891 RepID=A0A7Z0D970_9ACTN|nr:iron uptake system protein EfeO [Naumannella cuiyingiana]NYI71275.1 iron uptake system component EfeO [Naumannella cuiyingiana]
MIKSHRCAGAACLVAALAVALAGCTDNTSGAAPGDPRALTVQSTDDACTVSGGGAPAGTLTFSVTNGGSQVTEFYLLGSDGLRILGEVENIGPGLSRDLVVNAPAGDYFTACKPGMIGDGIRNPFSVAPSDDQPAVSADDQQLAEQADQQYGSYVKDQTEQLLAQTRAFAEAYTAGSDDEARRLYPRARMHWERIEPVAESFGDLDPKMDAREADLQPGEEWTGWHVMEKDLWPQRAENYTALTTQERKRYADDLVANTEDLYNRTRDLTFSTDQIGNGATGLMEEVASGKVTGEEEYWSRTDLWDFQGNLEGARVAWQGLRPILQKKDPDLDATLEEEFAATQAELDSHRSGDGWKSYDELTEDDIKALSDRVNALGEPLSRLTAAVLS